MTRESGDAFLDLTQTDGAAVPNGMHTLWNRIVDLEQPQVITQLGLDVLKEVPHDCWYNIFGVHDECC